MARQISRTIAALVAGAVLTIAGTSFAGTRSTSSNAFKACVDSEHQLFQASGGSCGSGQTAVTWYAGISPAASSDLQTTLAATNKLVAQLRAQSASATKADKKLARRYAAEQKTLASASGAAAKIDALSDMSETMQLRMQMATDRRTKLLSEIANLLKKLSDTDDGIVQNLK